MDCLADTGVNIILVAILAVVLVFLALMGFYFAKKGKQNLKYIAALMFLISGIVGINAQPANIYAASSQTCTSAASNNHSSGNSKTPVSVQKVWNVPFNSSSEWNQFTRYNVSNNGSPGAVTYNLTASGGTGLITANNPSNITNVRDYYVFNPAGSVKDGEVRALVTVDNAVGVGTAQVGFVMRATDLGSGAHQRAVTAWTNVLLWGSGATIGGVWYGNEDAGGAFNYDGGTSGVVSSPITSLVADGSEATVTFADDINFADFAVGGNYINIVGVDPLVNGTQQITGAPNTHTLTFATTATGSWTSTGSIAFNYNIKRWIAAKVVGDQLTVKQWLTTQTEPAWNDPINSFTYTLPTTLTNGDPSPTSGKFGLIVAHEKDGKSVTLSNLKFTSLDP